MEILKDNFEQFIGYFSHIVIERIPFKLDENDPEVIDVTSNLGPDEYLMMEGFHIYINTDPIGSPKYLRIIERAEKEVEHNTMQRLIDIESKRQLLAEFKAHLVIYESDIIKRDNIWISKKSELEDFRIEDISERERRDINEFFLNLKYLFREKLILIENFLNKLKMDTIRKTADEKLSQIGAIQRLPFDKIPLYININVLATFFYERHQNGQIGSSRENLARFISTCFVDENNRPIKFETVKTYLKANKEEKRVSQDKRLPLPEE